LTKSNKLLPDLASNRGDISNSNQSRKSARSYAQISPRDFPMVSSKRLQNPPRQKNQRETTKIQITTVDREIIPYD